MLKDKSPAVPVPGVRPPRAILLHELFSGQLAIAEVLPEVLHLAHDIFLVLPSELTDDFSAIRRIGAETKKNQFRA